MYQYNYAFLLHDKLTLAAFVMLTLAIASSYVVKSLLMRGIFLFLALLFALYAGRLDWVGLGIVLAMGGIFYCAFQITSKLWRRVFFSLALVFAGATAFVKFPGIYNWYVASKIVLSPDAIPYSMNFNFSKSLIGLFFLWFSINTVANSGGWQRALKTGTTMGVVAVLVLIPLSYYLGYVAFDLKLTNFFYLWAVHNLLYTCIAEEALFRGMILKSLLLALQNFKGGKWVALVVSAVIFGLAHYLGGPKYMLLASVAGLFYGYAFMKTDRIETGIITHFMVNSVHFLAFTYPALQSAF